MLNVFLMYKSATNYKISRIKLHVRYYRMYKQAFVERFFLLKKINFIFSTTVGTYSLPLIESNLLKTVSKLQVTETTVIYLDAQDYLKMKSS